MAAMPLFRGVAAVLLLSACARAQETPDDIDSACGNTDPTLFPFNATGTVSTPGFAPPSSLINASLGTLQTITFGTGIYDWYEPFSNYSHHETGQRWWVQTVPQMDLADPALPYYGHSTVLQGLTRSAYQNGLNDTGDCTKLLSPQCVADVLAEARNISLGMSGTQGGISDNLALVSPAPVSCRQFSTNGPNWISWLESDQVYIGSGSSSGDAEGPTVGADAYCNTTGKLLAVETLSVGNGTQSDPVGDYTNYDLAVLEVNPLLTVVWSKDAQHPWSDARLVCIRPNQFRQGSRVPTAIPSSAVATPRPGMVGVGAGLALLTFWTAVVLFSS